MSYTSIEHSQVDPALSSAGTGVHLEDDDPSADDWYAEPTGFSYAGSISGGCHSDKESEIEIVEGNSTNIEELSPGC